MHNHTRTRTRARMLVGLCAGSLRAGRPEDLIVSNIAVPPVAIRPSVDMDGASNEDDITMKLMVGWGPRRQQGGDGEGTGAGGEGNAPRDVVGQQLPNWCGSPASPPSHRFTPHADPRSRTTRLCVRLLAPCPPLPPPLLQQIIEVNNVLRQGLAKGLPISNLMENWDFLQVGRAGGAGRAARYYTCAMTPVHVRCECSTHARAGQAVWSAALLPPP